MRECGVMEVDSENGLASSDFESFWEAGSLLLRQVDAQRTSASTSDWVHASLRRQG